MYCPQCGTESPGDLRYCRSCGANLKVIGKALSLGQAIARSDRGPLPKIKEMMKSLKIAQVTEDISRALDQMNNEIIKTSDDPIPHKPWWSREPKSAAQRREKLMVKGIVSLFSGAGLMVFLYYLSAALVLKLPPNVVAQIPFEIEPVLHVIWLVGLIPMLSGLGHIIAGLTIRSDRVSTSEMKELPRPENENRQMMPPPDSVTEGTTNILHTQIRRDASKLR